MSGRGRIDNAIEFRGPQQREALVTEPDIVRFLKRRIHMHHDSDCVSRQLLWGTQSDPIADLERFSWHMTLPL